MLGEVGGIVYFFPSGQYQNPLHAVHFSEGRFPESRFASLILRPFKMMSGAVTMSSSIFFGGMCVLRRRHTVSCRALGCFGTWHIEPVIVGAWRSVQNESSEIDAKIRACRQIPRQHLISDVWISSFEGL